MLRPKTLSRIKQERLASKEHMRAVLHSLELLDVQLIPAENAYPAADPSQSVYRDYHDGRAFLYSAASGEATWMTFQESPQMTRVILNPDEGGPLHTGYQFLAAKGLPISFRRDELSLF